MKEICFGTYKLDKTEWLCVDPKVKQRQEQKTVSYEVWESFRLGNMGSLG